MPTETMTARERWLAVLQHRRPDRAPLDYWATPEVDRSLMAHLGQSSKVEMLRALHVDFVVDIVPRYVGPALPPGRDVWGIGYRDMPYAGGVYAEAAYRPLAQYETLDEIRHNHTWPEPDWWDWSEVAQQVRGFEDHPIAGGGSQPFMIYKDLRGHERALMDLRECPDIAHYCIDQISEVFYQGTVRAFEALPGQITLTYVDEDLGGQRNLMISPAQIREFLFPGMRRMIELGHGAGAYIRHHDDGAISRILPELVELGIDFLNPLQWRAEGMDRAWLKREFGSRIALHGGMDNQYTLPFGTVAEVRQEVRDNLRILGDGGGYILAPCHNLQPITPIDNILALYATAYDEGWY
ncbi:MAG: uroporphyrinogen decarboxylase family protein [Anaerolineales bacterium]